MAITQIDNKLSIDLLHYGEYSKRLQRAFVMGVEIIAVVTVSYGAGCRIKSKLYGACIRVTDAPCVCDVIPDRHTGV